MFALFFVLYFSFGLLIWITVRFHHMPSDLIVSCCLLVYSIGWDILRTQISYCFRCFTHFFMYVKKAYIPLYIRCMHTEPVQVNQLIQGALFYVLFLKKWQDWENNFFASQVCLYNITVYPNTACATFFLSINRPIDIRYKRYKLIWFIFGIKFFLFFPLKTGFDFFLNEIATLIFLLNII